LRDFISLGTHKLVVEGGGRLRRRRVKCRIASYNYFIRFLTRIPASLLVWERRPQHLERLKSSESQETKVIGSN
jgi:hypothetical protein